MSTANNIAILAPSQETAIATAALLAAHDIAPGDAETTIVGLIGGAARAASRSNNPVLIKRTADAMRAAATMLIAGEA